MTFEAVNAAEYLSANSFDIIHNHADWFLLPFHRQIKGSLVTTCHRSYKNATVKATMLAEFKDLPFVSISEDQRTQLPILNYKRTIYHGINLEKYEFNKTLVIIFCFWAE